MKSYVILSCSKTSDEKKPVLTLTRLQSQCPDNGSEFLCVCQNEVKSSNWCVKMAKKNTLREVKSISSSKIKDVFAYSDHWEAWEVVGDDEDDWSFLAEGSFEECTRCIQALITIELEYEIRGENNMTMRENPDWFLDALKKRHQEQVEEIKRECFQKGQYITPDWSLRSVRNRHQCEWIAKNGNPSPHYPGA